MVTPSREALLSWARTVAPDLRIGHATIDDHRACFARFTFAGEDHELEALSDNPDNEIALLVAEALRSLLGMPPLNAPDRAVALEQSIVRADLAGDNDARNALTRELLLGRATQPATFQGKTKFFKREIW